MPIWDNRASNACLINLQHVGDDPRPHERKAAIRLEA